MAADVASAKRHFGEAVALDDDLVAVETYRTSMAFQHAMLAKYTSFEAALKRLLAMLGEPLPGAPDPHAALLRRAGQAIADQRPVILSVALLRQADDLRRFRHVALQSYDDFQPGRAAAPVAAARAFLALIDSELAAFRTTIDPPDAV